VVCAGTNEGTEALGYLNTLLAANCVHVMLHSSMILAIDFGTSRCKVGVIDGNGDVLSIAVKELGTQEPGGAAQTSERVWRSTVFRCVRDALAKAGTSRVAIVSVTAQTASPVCFDANDHPIGPIISHLDSRAKPNLRKATEILPESYVASKLVGNLGWIKETEPKTFGRIEKVCDVKEYVGKLLTGRLTHDSMQLPRDRIMKMADALDIGEEVFGDDHDFATPIGGCNAAARDSCGLPRGTPVLVCPFDGLTGAVGSGLTHANVGAEIVGTTEFMATTTRKVNHSFPSVGWDSIDQADPRDHLRIVYTSPPLGFFYDWFRFILYGKGHGSQRSVVEDELSKSNPSDMLFVPRFSTETHNWTGHGQMLDIEPGMKRADVLRSVMEGITMNVKQIMKDLKGDEDPVESINLSGGGSKSEVWNQMRADICGVPVSLLQTPETGCLGGAVFAATSLGLYRNLREASERMVHIAKQYFPNPGRSKQYERVYRRFETKYLETD